HRLEPIAVREASVVLRRFTVGARAWWLLAALLIAPFLRAHVFARGGRAAIDDSAAATAGITRSSWTSIGPGNIGGRVRAIAVHPTTASTLFVGGANGGIWRSTDSGASWQA